MLIPEPAVIEREGLDEMLAALPNSDAVFVVWAGDRSSYLAKTSMLRRRLLRILKPASGQGRSLNLREVFTRVEYWLTSSRFESMLLHYALARRHFPDDYLRLVKLRMPAYVKLILSNEYPRTQVTTRLGGGRGIYYGPFRTRASAELFENQFLDFVSDPALSGKPGAESAASRLHLRRDEHVPASVPAGGDAAKNT